MSKQTDDPAKRDLIQIKRDQVQIKRDVILVNRVLQCMQRVVIPKVKQERSKAVSLSGVGSRHAQKRDVKRSKETYYVSKLS